MAEGVHQASEKVLTTFPVPYKGVLRGTSEVELPRDALWTGQNLHFFEGELRQRQSWNLLRQATVAAPLKFANQGDITTLFTGHRAGSRRKLLFTGGRGGVRALQGAAPAGWVTLVTWASAGESFEPTRFTEIATDTPLSTKVIYTNGRNTPRYVTIPSTGAAFGADVVMTGAPFWKDVCVASDRVLGITDTEVSWGEALRLDVWPALNVKSLAETLDLCIAIRPLGTLNVGIWKEHTLWLGQARGGSSAGYFSWRLLKVVDGPATPNAICADSKGNGYWMTRTGRIVMMGEGYKITYPGDGVWSTVRGELPVLNDNRLTMHATYVPDNDEVWFFYMHEGAVDGCGGTARIQRAVILCNPSTKPAAFVATFPGAAGLMNISASGVIGETTFSGGSAQYHDEAVIVYELAAANAAAVLALPRELQSTGDDTFTALMQTGLQQAPGQDSHRLESVEYFLRRGAAVHPGTATMTMRPLSSYVLDVQAGTVGASVSMTGLNDAAIPIKAITGADDIRGRFFGFRLEGANINSAFRYLGAVLRGRRLD